MVVNGQTVPTPDVRRRGRIFHRLRTTVPTENGDRHGTAHNPDVAMHASRAAWPVYLSRPVVAVQSQAPTGGFYAIAGTSASSPYFASSAALLAASQRLAGQPGLGHIALPLCTTSAATTRWRCTTSGNNDVYGVGCCRATPGYDTAQAWALQHSTGSAVDRTGRRPPGSAGAADQQRDVSSGARCRTSSRSRTCSHGPAVAVVAIVLDAGVLHDHDAVAVGVLHEPGGIVGAHADAAVADVGVALGSTDHGAEWMYCRTTRSASRCTRRAGSSPDRPRERHGGGVHDDVVFLAHQHIDTRPGLVSRLAAGGGDGADDLAACA